MEATDRPSSSPSGRRRSAKIHFLLDHTDDADPSDRPAAPALRHRARVRGRRSRHDSAETMAGLEARRLSYILGVRERSDKLVRELVLDDPGPFVSLTTKKRGRGIDYEAKTVMLARYIACRNHQEAEKDAADRASIVAALERQLAKGDKALIDRSRSDRALQCGPPSALFSTSARKLQNTWPRMVSSSLWKIGRGGEEVLGRTEGLLHRPKLLVAEHGLERVEIGEAGVSLSSDSGY